MFEEENDGTTVSSTKGLEQKSRARSELSNFGTVVRALWPRKPALNLSQRLDITERAALYLINGERKITARCVQVIINELFK